jgi:hypothetical protein
VIPRPLLLLEESEGRHRSRSTKNRLGIRWSVAESAQGRLGEERETERQREKKSQVRVR